MIYLTFRNIQLHSIVLPVVDQRLRVNVKLVIEILNDNSEEIIFVIYFDRSNTAVETGDCYDEAHLFMMRHV